MKLKKKHILLLFTILLIFLYTNAFIKNQKQLAQEEFVQKDEELIKSIKKETAIIPTRMISNSNSNSNKSQSQQTVIFIPLDSKGIPMTNLKQPLFEIATTAENQVKNEKKQPIKISVVPTKKASHSSLTYFYTKTDVYIWDLKKKIGTKKVLLLIN